MKTAQTSDTINENLASAGKFFSESYYSMADAYRKQWETSLGMYSRLFSPWSGDGRVGMPGFEFPGMDQIRKNMDMMSDYTRNMMFPWTNKSPLFQWGWWDGHSATDTLFDAYKSQLKQLSEINHRFAKTFLGSFDTINTDFEHIYESFLKSSESNLRLTEDSLNKIRAAYESVSNESVKNFQKMVEKANAQVETFTRNNMNMWNEILNNTVKTGKKTKEKTASE